MSKIPYESAVGSLMYLMVSTRPDIALAMSKVSKYTANLGEIHWEAVKWIMRYIKGTLDMGILFDARAMNAKILIGYVDFDHAQDLDKRRSTTGFVFTLGGGCISWRSILQKCVSLSSTEAEYVAAAEAAKEALWLNRLVSDMGLRQWRIGLHCDSQSALHYAENHKMDGRLKHINIRYHFLRHQVEEKKITLIKIPGKENPSDALTKVIPVELFNKHCSKLQLLPLKE
jgi:ATP-binding cassette subfamily B (MDR/TAP) protein 1